MNDKNFDIPEVKLIELNKDFISTSVCGHISILISITEHHQFFLQISLPLSPLLPPV